ncbi:DUF3108 domain-containing protein [Jannaschia sp. W003]|uniref:DUF3108 domain-containing protein n=1 Tax=Jannaschia sp. W003 TaxID=2867012 RepID=UPI0021A6D9A0|nr:DUF3108 domain-containing protein [Jannaschia sp. W003]UWQ22288.1 DUF3108 domain-containing protein [Jannaschia sp. W003]
MRIFLLLALLAAPASAEQLRFDVGMHGVRAAQMVLNGDVSGGGYAVAGQVKGTGLVGAVVDIDYAAEARGAVAGGRLRSGAATLRDRMGDEQGTTAMQWSGGAPRVTQSPGFPREPYDIDAAAQRGAVDPLTALYDLLRTQPRESLCNWTAATFDGRRAARLSVGPPRDAGNGAVRCDAEYRRVAGYEPEEMAERTRYPFSVTYVPAGNAMAAAEMRAATKYGDAVIRRR